MDVQLIIWVPVSTWKGLCLSEATTEPPVLRMATGGAGSRVCPWGPPLFCKFILRLLQT